MSLLNIPIAELLRTGQLAAAMMERDQRDEKIYAENKTFRREYHPVMLIGDALSDVRNPIDGKVYDSRSSYHRKLKEANCHVYEGPVVRQQPDHDISPELKRALADNLPTRRKYR